MQPPIGVQIANWIRRLNDIFCEKLSYQGTLSAPTFWP